MTILVKTLSLEMAKKMADAAEKAGSEKGLKLVIAIMDAHGNLKYYRRMDGNNFVSVRMAVLQTGAGKKAIAPAEPTLKVLSEALPEWSEYIGKYGEFGMSHILDELEKRLLAELQRSLDGKDDDKAQVEHAARIVELAQTAERKLIEGKLPNELRS